MWLLKNDSGTLIYLKPDKTLTVGRNKGDIVLSNDGSISRVHAKITVKPITEIAKIDDNTVPLSTCTVKDPNSKYGNFIIKDGCPDTKITEDGCMLQHMDRIRFGLQNYIFTALYVPIITATSGMNETEKNQLKLIIDAIDGKIIYVWTPMCTHMTIETPTISEKLSCALAFGTPIVSIDYWKAAMKAFQNNEAFPEPVEFAASINNKMTNIGKVCVTPNPMRKTCLQNLTFVHFNSKQYSLYNRIIKLAGGTSIKYGKQRSNLDVCCDNVIVVQLVESNTTQSTGTGDVNYAAICEQLGKCHRRTIPECEIALAILHCSTDKYCNPKYDYAELFRNRKSQFPESNSSILVLDTQDVDLPTTSGLQRHTQSDFVTESTEQTSELEYEATKSVCQYPINHTSESTSASSSYYSDSISSMKLVSLNHEKNLEQEFKKPLTVTENSMKRDREGDVKIDSTKKRMCLDVSVGNEERSRKPSVSHKLQVSYEDPMCADEDICFIDEKINVMKKVPKNKEGKRDAWGKSSVAKEHVEMSRYVMSEADRNSDVEEINASVIYDCKRKAQTYRTHILESEKKSSLTTDDDETSRKRKVGRSDTSPSWNVSENPRKRNKPMSNSEKEIFQVPPQVATLKKTEFAPPKQSKKTESEGHWTENKNYQPLDDSESSVDSKGNKSYGNHYAEISVFFQRPDDPNNTSTQRLLRITSPEHLTDSGVANFGKCFQKRYTITPCRVDLYDAADDIPWSSGMDPEKNASFNEEASTSLNTIRKSKKVLKV